MAIVMLAVLLALCGGGVYLAESRDRPRRKALREQASAQN